MRRDVRERAVGGLVVLEVAQPFGEEAGGLHRVRGGGREDVDVAGPAQAFVAGGGVGGDGEEIAAQAPGDVAVELVEQRDVGLELHGEGRVGVDHLPDDGVERRPAGVAGHFDVAEAVEGEAGLVGLPAAALEGVVVGRGGGAEVGGVDGAVGVEYLRVAQPNGSRRPGQ